jgi:hypothetical protein
MFFSNPLQSGHLNFAVLVANVLLKHPTQWQDNVSMNGSPWPIPHLKRYL